MPMWRRLRRLFCCAPDSSTIDLDVSEPKDPVDNSNSAGPNAPPSARARTLDTSIISQVSLVGGEPPPSPTTATTIIRERDSFRDATEQLSDLSSPPTPPSSMPLRKPEIGSSSDSPPGPNRASQPQAALSADGVKGSAPQTVIDSAIDIGFTPALNGFEAHTMPFIPESDTRERSILDDIPEHGTVPPAEIHDHPTAEQRDEVDSPTRSSSKSSLVEWSPIAEQAISDYGEQHGQSTTLPPQTCQSPAEPQSIARSTSTPPNDNLVPDGNASAPSSIASAAAERETGYRISQAAPACPTRQEHAKPAYLSPPPSPPLTGASSWLKPASPGIGLVAGECPTKC
ncbi:hypothetical protein FA13DRAFT_1774904 [Coprinellus micaceus]|uniref:Uncharacterized protein n=1 Tax=Coprinellus micaceus TaxID=71717 RepID=A0A4Y7T8H2_COPMI|nr:hypothetical protein FA13DRAFT_1774904 [Coprinellus micaceus]